MLVLLVPINIHGLPEDIVLDYLVQSGYKKIIREDGFYKITKDSKSTGVIVLNHIDQTSKMFKTILRKHKYKNNKNKKTNIICDINRYHNKEIKGYTN